MLSSVRIGDHVPKRKILLNEGSKNTCGFFDEERPQSANGFALHFCALRVYEPCGLVAF